VSALVRLLSPEEVKQCQHSRNRSGQASEEGAEREDPGGEGLSVRVEGFDAQAEQEKTQHAENRGPLEHLGSLWAFHGRGSRVRQGWDA